MPLSKRIITVFAVFALMFVFCCSNVSAESYVYNSYKETVNAPDVYDVLEKITGSDIGCGALKAPEDLFVTADGTVYIADTGNKRIVITDSNLTLIKTIEDFAMGEKPAKIKEITGVFVDAEGIIYFTDAKGGYIYRCDENGNIDLRLKQPDNGVFDEETLFVPEKVIVDRSGNIYVKCTGIYQGSVLYDKNGDFQGFFGADSVEETQTIVSDYFWKSMMNDTQKEQTARVVPPEIRAFDIDSEDFIYTVTNSGTTAGSTKIAMDKFRKLNPKGSGVLVNKMPREAKMALERDGLALAFIDVNITSDDYLLAVDKNFGRVFEFDRDMNLITAFGSIGNEYGTFQAPIAIESFNNNIYVLDKTTCSITIFGLTEFGNTIHQAINIYNSGYYEKAIDPWLEVAARSSNYELAYVGLGNAYMNIHDYEKAIHYFELGRDSEGYNEAFIELRAQFLRKYLVYIVSGIVVIAGGIYATLYFIRRRRKA